MSTDGASQKIASIVSFIDTNLRTVKSETDPSLSSWYRSHAWIVVVPDHTCFSDPEQNRKVAKNRFGHVVRAEIEVGNGGNPIGRMLRAHESDARDWIVEKVLEWEVANRDPDETEDEDMLGVGRVEAVEHEEDLREIARVERENVERENMGSSRVPVAVGSVAQRWD